MDRRAFDRLIPMAAAYEPLRDLGSPLRVPPGAALGASTGWTLVIFSTTGLGHL
jgi:hypothetical protein